MWQNIFKRCYGLAKFEFDPNDTRRIAVTENDKMEHIQMINLISVSKYKYSVKITNLHYLQIETESDRRWLCVLERTILISCLLKVNVTVTALWQGLDHSWRYLVDCCHVTWPLFMSFSYSKNHIIVDTKLMLIILGKEIVKEEVL